MTPTLVAVSRHHGSRVAKARDASKPGRPANDNGDAPLIADEVAAALRHFAHHGLAAAEVARSNAERAAVAGGWMDYAHWLNICGALDRRLAEQCRRAVAEF